MLAMSKAMEPGQQQHIDICIRSTDMAVTRSCACVALTDVGLFTDSPTITI